MKHVNLDPLLWQSDAVGIDRELAKRSLSEFVSIAWDQVEPATPFIPSWHIDAICDHLQAIYEGHITRLVINVPPGASKSLSCCVFFPAWLWTQRPSTKLIYAGYSDKIVLRDSRRNRRLIKSKWYQDRWGDQYHILQNEDSAGRYTNDKGGFRQSTTVKGGITGEHADIQVVDDPIKPLEVSKTMNVAKNALDETKLWWSETMASRLVDFYKSARIIIMQRLHEDDLAGAVLKEKGYEHLMLPMEYEPKRSCSTSIGFTDPRQEEGELLSPSRFPKESVESIKKDLGSRAAQAQLQQNPIPEEGSIIKLDWFKYYIERPKSFIIMIQSWDCTFKGSSETDFVVGQVWGVHRGGFYLLDQIRKRLTFTQTCEAIKKLSMKWPKARAKLIEDKANGPAIMDHLKREISGLVPFNPSGGKIARVHAVEPLWEAGNVYIPDPKTTPWVSSADGFVAEVTGFPSRAHDDQVDAMAQALIYLEGKKLLRLRNAMSRF